MEKLNEYLQTLLSTCSYELHLEPNKNPYLTSDSGETEIARTPLLGTQISMLIFPLIPPDVKQKLPNKPEVEFVYNHPLGNFSFLIKKSAAGFIVTIRPLLSDFQDLREAENYLKNYDDFASNEVEISPVRVPLKQDYKSLPTLVQAEEKELFAKTVSLTESKNYAEKLSVDSRPEITNEFSGSPVEIITDYSGANFRETSPEIEMAPVYQPEFTTDFSNISNYEPPLRPQEFQIVPQPVEYKQNQAAVQDFAIVEPPSVSPVKAGANVPSGRRMDALFHKMAEAGASDLHLSVSMSPMIRKDGRMMMLESAERTLTSDSMKELLTSIMPAKNQEEFNQRHDTDFAYEIEGLARFRANIFMDRKGMGGVFRIIPTKILTAEQLGLSKAIMDLCNLSKGLVVVTGPTGSGKSTTLCAMVDSINKNREDHIITIEDPIEFTHENQKCLVNQREVHNHTDSFKDALRAALREDPDILLVGEMRDLETISIAIETAETGHLVFGTLHTTTAASTIDRIIDQFPADRQQQIRVMLSESLKGVIAQTLLPKKGGGRVAALEVLIVTPAISNLIREGKTFQIPSAMQTGKAIGMTMLNDALFDLVKKGLVEPKDAYIKAVDKANFESLLTRNGMKL